MVIYKCPRCNYTTHQRCDIKKHFKRKTPCIIVNEELSIKACISSVLGRKYGKTLENPSKSLIREEKLLKIPLNPSKSLKIPHLRGISRVFPRKSLSNEEKLLKSHSNQEFNENQCSLCKKTFSRKDNLLRHITLCKNEHFTENYISRNEVENILKIEREKSEYIINELKSQVETLLKYQGSHNTYTTNYNIVLNQFGKENTDYISNDYIHSLIKSGPVKSIPRLLKYIHFNPEHKENHNIKIPNKKKNYAQVFNGIDWEYRDKMETIQNMSGRAFDIINSHYLIGSNPYMDTFHESYEKEDKNLCKKLLKDTECMILNNQKVVNERKNTNL
tara:strand:+ start:1046 stop:2041 length:996 start_codon:yes stop_codon:yes gene_type:complete